ncbi:dTDP-glucose 4,6-dehydratase [Streptomyces sp. NPDC048483]|uniref:dTDP-glucose 4,6-dehydratase n=1 Tax=Streptomyces sp. NPDC048483 TaxID=3154927 RepID=UPI00341421BB
MRILVTGGAGFIGSCYIRQLLEGSHPGYESARITVLDKLTYAGHTGNLPIGHPRLSFEQADICNLNRLCEVLPGHDAVVHLAGESHVDRSLSGALPFATTNVIGTQTLLDAAVQAGVSRFVHVSTAEVYGSAATGSWNERHVLEPSSPYAASKAASDLVALSYWRTHGMHVSVTRCGNNYGPRQYPEKLVPLVIASLLDGRDAPIYGEGSNRREWIHVADHCRAIQLVLEKGHAGEVYNVGGGTELSNLALAERLAELCGVPPERLRRRPDRKVNDLRYALDGRKLREDLGFVPRIPFDQGLAEVVAWYRENRGWWQPLLRPAGLRTRAGRG